MQREEIPLNTHISPFHTNAFYSNTLFSHILHTNHPFFFSFSFGCLNPSFSKTSRASQFALLAALLVQQQQAAQLLALNALLQQREEGERQQERQQQQRRRRKQFQAEQPPQSQSRERAAPLMEGANRKRTRGSEMRVNETENASSDPPPSTGFQPPNFKVCPFL